MKTHELQITIDYLDSVEVESGRPAEYGDGYYCDGRFVPRVPTRKVLPTQGVVTVDARIASIEIGWGDRVARDETPGIWGDLADGRQYSRTDSGWTVDSYYGVADDLVAAFDAAKAAVAEAWSADLSERADAAAVVEHYRAAVFDELDREYAAHALRWASDVQAIARRFRRRKVIVGEQTVPGKCVVRSTRGTKLGHAHVWDGVWLGTVEHC